MRHCRSSRRFEVRQAIKYAIDYDAIANNITPNVWNVWQTFLPTGSPGAIVRTLEQSLELVGVEIVGDVRIALLQQ